MEKVFVDSEQREREVVTGWSCTFDKGLCESWMTKEVLSDSIKEDISLATRILDGTKPGNCFWYHIYGRSGSEPSKFEVLINKNPKNKNAEGWSSLFQVNTDVSNDRFDWKYASLNIKPDLEKEKDWKTVLFALIARRGGGYIPDIAIDDVQLRSDKCPEIPPRQKSEQELKEIEKRMENWSPLGTTPAAPIKVPQKDFYRHEFFTAEFNIITKTKSARAPKEKSSEICCGGKAQARYPGAKCCEQKKTVYNHNKYECCGSRIYKRGDLKRRNEFCCGAVAYSFETFPDGCCNQQLLQGGKSCCSVTRWKERVYNEQDEICCDGVFSAYLYQCKITKKGERKVLKLTNDQRKAMFDIDFPGEYRWVNKAAFAAMVKGTGKHVKLSEDEYEDYMQSILSPGAPIF
ncbi:Oidioi.mRNA.OKI2018_I69.XSR.g15713.t1.cds [Oikopleura dioica]|uniref:Oidioi.mRNA.OKI2018_I69.XSR.g15713.t1.cds n=1 Tax=Oikopleura dioica TaxID=34765 RepID=A0ABN7SDQ9_OIKDI|nr:Oidioi.mRNA.OKI2018_I69.XSR.g15713.t1.cds [Oikopleura dioica]